MEIQMQLSEILNRFYKELNDDSFPTSLFEYDTYSILFIRYLSIHNELLILKSATFVFSKNYVAQYSREKSEFKQLDDYSSFILSVKSILKQNRVVLGSLVDIVEKLEECVYSRSVPHHFVEAWFKVKKKLSTIDRYYSRLTSVFIDLVDSNIAGKQQGHFHKLMGRFDFELTRTDLLLKKIDGLYSYYELIKSDRLNRNVYLLTIISAIFLPLNLIVGFFGMNSMNLFFSKNPQGTMLITCFLICVFIFSISAIPVSRFVFNKIKERNKKTFNLFKMIVDPIEILKNKII